MTYLCVNDCEYDGIKYTKGQIYVIKAGIFGGVMHYSVNGKEVSRHFFKTNFIHADETKITAKGGDTYGPKTIERTIPPFVVLKRDKTL
ncbi:MAG: hypothetical protein MJZ24_04675 [Paludibacteraceae bacterium]|nr:hypothetical protein [Paludibacteraceae bacterium]